MEHARGKTCFFKSPIIYHSCRCVQRYQGEQCEEIPLSRAGDGICSTHLSRRTPRFEACLRAQQNKLYHMGIRTGIQELADANEQRDWRIYADFAQALIKIARPLYAKEDLGLDLDNTVYALDNYRSLPFRISLGAVPSNQVSRQTPYITGFKREYSDLYSYLRRQATRRQCARHSHNRTRGFLHHGSGICRFRATVYTQSGGKLLRHSGQAQYPVQTPILPCYRYIQWTEMRSVHRSNGGQHKGRLSSAITTSQIPRQQDRKDLQLSDQQLRHSSADHSRSLSLSMAGRALFQMDQTALEDQILFWHLRECREESDLDAMAFG